MSVSFPSTVVNKVNNKINILHCCKRPNKSLSKHEDTHLRCNIFYEGQLLIHIYLFQDTIGAGDSFIAGFIFVLLREGSLRSCIEYAVGSEMLNCTWQSLSSDLDGSEDDPASRGDPSYKQTRASSPPAWKKGAILENLE